MNQEMQNGDRLIMLTIVVIGTCNPIGLCTILLDPETGCRSSRTKGKAPSLIHFI